MSLLTIVLSVILALAGMVAFVRFYEAKALFLPATEIHATPADQGLAYEDVYFPTADQVTINGWFVRSSRGHNAPAVIFLHGNAGNISHRMDKIALLHRLGLNVFIIDYRGYGRSQGRPSESGIYLDSQAAFDYLARRSDIDPQKILVYGESLGGAAAVDLAVNRPVAGLIGESIFSSARDMAKVIMPIVPEFLIRVKMDSLSKIPEVRVPKLLIHSRYDEIVPFRLAQKLFAAASAPKEFLEIDGDHNEGYALSDRVYRKGIQAFLEKYGFVPYRQSSQ